MGGNKSRISCEEIEKKVSGVVWHSGVVSVEFGRDG